jgi:hypothetical protein
VAEHQPEDKPTVHIHRPTDLAGAIPHMVGYSPADNQVAILGFHGSDYTGVAVHTWTAELGDGPAHARAATLHIAGAFGDRAESYLAIGYGLTDPSGHSCSRMPSPSTPGSPPTPGR